MDRVTARLPERAARLDDTLRLVQLGPSSPPSP
jgi:hypothetical protein